jgi:hypothetical protein
MIGRAAAVPLPERFRSRLGSSLARISATASDYLNASAAALAAYRVPPPLDAVEAALDGYDAEFALMRREGLTRELSEETAERVFALGFALEQLRRNCNDLARCVTELAPSRSAAAAKPAANSGPAPQ